MFPRDLAILSILYLVLGDMTAALVGVSFGGDAIVLKRGRAKASKSAEGSLGMFAVCFLLG
jgi:dolichol kinase